MAAVVDGQNAGDVNYINMTGNYTGFAFKAALDLIMNGRDIANGYTGPTLHHWRKFCKTAQH